MGRLSLALVLHYFLLRWRLIFLGFILSSFIIIGYSLFQMGSVKRLEYAFFELDLIYRHQLSTVYYIHSVMSLIFILVYLSQLKTSILDVFLRTYLKGVFPFIFHLVFLICGLFIFGSWSLLLVNALTNYYNQSFTPPYMWVIHMMMDGLIIYGLFIFISSKIPSMIYLSLKMIVLTIGISGTNKKWVSMVLNYVIFDETWQFPFNTVLGLGILFIIYGAGFYHICKQKHL